MVAPVEFHSKYGEDSEKSNSENADRAIGTKFRVSYTGKFKLSGVFAPLGSSSCNEEQMTSERLNEWKSRAVIGVVANSCGF